MKHEDTHMRCLVDHQDVFNGQCIKCTCGEYVRPDRWDAHVAADPVKESKGYTIRKEGTTFLVEPIQRPIA